MSLSLSNKALLLTEHSSPSMTLKKVLPAHGIEIASGYLSLHSLDMIRKVIRNTRNTTAIRTELLKFIREQGFPFFIAMDFRIDSGLPEEMDPDKLKLLRTFLISFIILSRGTGFENLRGNFLLLYDQKSAQQVQSIESNPRTLMNLIATKDPKINGFIDELKNDQQKFNRIFYVKGLYLNSESNDFFLGIENFLQGIKAREKLMVAQQRQAATTKVMDTVERAAAKVLYLLNDGRLYVDGEFSSPEEEKADGLETNRIYIKGPWTGRTQKEVATKIIKAVKGNINSEAEFLPEEPVIIDLTGGCDVDAATTVSMAQLAGKDLIAYKGLSFRVNDTIYNTLQHSDGFSLIKKQISFSE